MSDSKDDIVDGLIRVTRSGNFTEDRVEAIKSLTTYLHDPRVREALIRLTSSGELEPVRLAAIRALGGRTKD
jgi:HEAT repeat protein